uniref:Uncharacterized protein n=1 Tax=Arundo donax TaxID=35708 RepID=A0A0A9CVE4_ARUDO
MSFNVPQAIEILTGCYILVQVFHNVSLFILMLHYGVFSFLHYL